MIIYLKFEKISMFNKQELVMTSPYSNKPQCYVVPIKGKQTRKYVGVFNRDTRVRSTRVQFLDRKSLRISKKSSFR